MGWFTHIPALATLPLLGSVSAGLAVGAHCLFRRIVPPEKLVEQHAVAAALISVIGVLYSVVLGFLVGTVWTSFDAAQRTADREARYVAVAFYDASELPNPYRRAVQRKIAQYAFEVRDVEWLELSRGRIDPRARALLSDTIQLILAIPPPAKPAPGEFLRQVAIINATAESLRNIGDIRGERVAQARSRLPSVVFEALILGGLLVMAFTFLFGVKPLPLQMTMTALVAACIGIFFGLIVDLNTPYAGPVRVSPDVWTSIIQSDRLAEFAK